ncbi:hypothetical protein HPB50_014956 [Hyalomma asiaticum]|uniref:Uncharacterized protein n=1 Tax=Hyalomma asiaticum TaxID=266040 RepID=A0ACB7S081_HYAAI|nr:hypothetical protein HPB50_014956 [Hyalomma asiaticum]
MDTMDEDYDLDGVELTPIEEYDFAKGNGEFCRSCSYRPCTTNQQHHRNCSSGVRARETRGASSARRCADARARVVVGALGSPERLRRLRQKVFRSSRAARGFSLKAANSWVVPWARRREDGQRSNRPLALGRGGRSAAAAGEASANTPRKIPSMGARAWGRPAGGAVIPS